MPTLRVGRSIGYGKAGEIVSARDREDHVRGDWATNTQLSGPLKKHSDVACGQVGDLVGFQGGAAHDTGKRR